MRIRYKNFGLIYSTLRIHFYWIFLMVLMANLGCAKKINSSIKIDDSITESILKEPKSGIKESITNFNTLKEIDSIKYNQLKDGFKHGIWKEFDLNGQLIEE